MNPQSYRGPTHFTTHKRSKADRREREICRTLAKRLSDEATFFGVRFRLRVMMIYRQPQSSPASQLQNNTHPNNDFAHCEKDTQWVKGKILINVGTRRVEVFSRRLCVQIPALDFVLEIKLFKNICLRGAGCLSNYDSRVIINVKF